MEEMTKEEMQRYLNQEAQRGSTEIEAYKNLMDILGLVFPAPQVRKLLTEKQIGAQAYFNSSNSPSTSRTQCCAASRSKVV